MDRKTLLLVVAVFVGFIALLVVLTAIEYVRVMNSGPMIDN